MGRPELVQIEARFQLDTSSTVLLGEPGSGKSALLSRVASDLRDRSATVFALKSDFLSPEVSTETDLQRDLQLPGAPSDLILRLAALRSEEHTSELQSLMRISYAVFCLKKKTRERNTYYVILHL